MSDYNQYITAVNKIFDYLSKMRAGWTSLDNDSYISSIEEYRQSVIDGLELFKKQQQATPPSESKTQVAEQQPKEVEK